jgi:hypothetical protein
MQENCVKIKAWWHTATLFLFYFYIIRAEIQYFYIYYTRRVPPCCPHGFRSVEGLLWGAEPRFELWPALQQADASEHEFKQKHRVGYM